MDVSILLGVAQTLVAGSSLSYCHLSLWGDPLCWWPWRMFHVFVYLFPCNEELKWTDCRTVPYTLPCTVYRPQYTVLLRLRKISSTLCTAAGCSEQRFLRSAVTARLGYTAPVLDFYRRLRTTCRSHLHCLTVEYGTDVLSETSVNNNQHTLCNNPQEQRPNLHCGWGVQFRRSYVFSSTPPQNLRWKP